jgi:hypothetical protein
MSGDSGGDPMAAIAALNQGNNIQAKTPPWMQGVGAQTMPQAMPGQLEAIAAQLAGGYSAPNAAAQKTGTAGFMKHLDQVYDPVRTMNFAPPPPPKPVVKPVVKPVAKPVVTPKPVVKPVVKKPAVYGTGSWAPDAKGNPVQFMTKRPLGRNAR